MSGRRLPRSEIDPGTFASLPGICPETACNRRQSDPRNPFPEFPSNPERPHKLPSREQLEELLQSDPDDIFLNYALAQQYVAEGAVEKGLQQYSRTLKLDPDYVPAYFHQAQTLAANGNVEKARSVITQGIAIAGKTGEAHAEMEMTAFLDSL